MSKLSKRTKRHKLASIALSVTTTLWLSGAAYMVPVVAHGQITTADLQAQIQALLAQITTLQSQLAILQGSTTTAVSCTFTRSLTIGSKGDDVKCLQKYFNGAGFTLASSGAGSPGNETTYFGSLTKAAAVKWQNANAATVLTPIGLSAGTGYWGPSSRAAYTTLIAGAPTTPTTPTTPAPVGTGLSVTAGVQPSASLFPDNATRVPFTVVVFTASFDGDITLDSLVVERTGLANDAAFAGVVLLDENGIQLGIAKTLNSLHQTTLTEDFVVKAGQTRVMTIAGNSKTSSSGYGGQIAYLSLVSVNVKNGATVTANYPITGAGHTINETLTIGTVTMARGNVDPGSSQTKEVGTNNYILSAVRVTAGSQEKIYLESIRWNQIGSAGESDLGNVVTIIDGTEYPITVSADGKYYTSSFGNGMKGILIDKGFSKDVYIRADITGGSSRTIIFDIAKRTDIGLFGETYGYGITPPVTGLSASPGDSAFSSSEDPWYNASTVTVSAGTITVSTSNQAPAANIAINLSNQILGAFEVNVRGEPITVGAMDFNFTIVTDTGSTDDIDDITSVSLVDENGTIVAGPVDGSATADTTGANDLGGEGVVTFTDTVTFPVGVNTYFLKGKIGTDLDNNDTVLASTTPSTQWTTVTGQTTGNSLTPSPSSALTFNTMTIKTGAFEVSVQSVPIAQTVIAGVNQFTFANYVFDSTASGEDIRVTSIPLALDRVSGGGLVTELTNCQLYDGATSVTSNTFVNPTAESSSTSFTFNGTGITIPKGSSKTISVKCNVSGSATSTVFAWGLDSDEAGTSYTAASGITSGQTVSETFNDSVGQRMTIAGNGSITVTLDNGSPAYAIVNSGAAGVELAKIRFSAANEDINLKQVGLQLTGTASNTISDLVGNKVTLWDGATQVGTAIFSSTNNTYATSSTITNFTIPRSGSKVMTIKADIAAISDIGPLIASGDLLIVDYDADNEGSPSATDGTYGTGLSSGSTINPSTGSDTASNGVRINKAYPTFTKLSVPNNTLRIGDRVDPLYRFSIKANGGDIALYKWTFVIGSSTGNVAAATTSTYELSAFTDNAFSSADSFGVSGLINYGSCVNGKSANDVNDLVLEIYPDKGTTDCNATTTLIIGSGQTRWFELRANVTNVEGVTGTESITIRLEGDAAYPVNANTLMQKAADVDGDTNDDFLWSPISTTTSNLITDLDFVNGYSNPGLPATNMPTETFTSAN